MIAILTLLAVALQLLGPGPAVPAADGSVEFTSSFTAGASSTRKRVSMGCATLACATDGSPSLPTDGWPVER